MAENFLYVIAANDAGPVKIGITNNPERRLKQLQTGHPEKLAIRHRRTIPGERARVAILEDIVHTQARPWRMQGEWFNMTVEKAILYVTMTMARWEDEDVVRMRRLGLTPR